MLTMRRMAAAALLACLSVGLLRADAGGPADTKEPDVTTIRFARGAWDPAAWTAVRMANQAQPKTFAQEDDALATTKLTFTQQDYNAERDNAIMVRDLGADDTEVAVTFTIGQGFGGFSAPGLCVAPRIKEGVLVSSIAVFVADYTMAAWFQDTAPDGKTVRYRHLFQLGRWSDPTKPHVLRCRVSKKEASVAFKVDDSDVIVLTFVGNPALSFVDQELNSTLGIWGCHGECRFPQMTIQKPGSLPFLVRTPAKQP